MDLRLEHFMFLLHQRGVAAWIYRRGTSHRVLRNLRPFLLVPVIGGIVASGASALPHHVHVVASLSQLVLLGQVRKLGWTQRSRRSLVSKRQLLDLLLNSAAVAACLISMLLLLLGRTEVSLLLVVHVE